MELEQRIMPLMFVLAGATNVLLIKYTDIEKGQCSDGKCNFFHPVFQTLIMFLGQLILLIVFKVTHWFLQRRGDGSENENLITRGGREFSCFVLVLPAFLDAISSVLLFTGLYLTYASSFQMIRGAAIIFIGIFSSIYLNQSLVSRHWMAMFTIACGITIILSVDVQRIVYDRAGLINNTDSNSILTGDLLIIIAQIFHAAQIVYEEKHLKDSDIPPMQAAGLQGLFGFGITILLYAALNFMPTELAFIDNSRNVFDDMSDVFMQLGSNIWILIALLGFILTSALYNYSALSIVKFSSSANRILADGLRVMLIWLFALLFNWEIVNFVSILGFIVLQLGAISYRNAILMDWYRSVLARLMRRRYDDLNDANASAAVPASQPADVI